MPQFEEVSFDSMINGEMYYCFGIHGYYIGIMDHFLHTHAKFKRVRYITNEITEMNEVLLDNTYKIYKIIP
jgi:hypothetical protein